MSKQLGGRRGAIYAVKVGDMGGGTVRSLFVKAMAEAMKATVPGFRLVGERPTRQGKDPKPVRMTPDDLRRVAQFLIDELDMGASAQALGGGPGAPERVNEVVRAGVHAGVPMLSIMRRMLQDAWIAHDREVAKGEGGKPQTARGMVRGQAQMLAFVLSPYTWDDMDAAERRAVIADLERDTHAEARLRLNVDKSI